MSPSELQDPEVFGVIVPLLVTVPLPDTSPLFVIAAPLLLVIPPLLTSVPPSSIVIVPLLTSVPSMTRVSPFDIYGSVVGHRDAGSHRQRLCRGIVISRGETVSPAGTVKSAVG